MPDQVICDTSPLFYLHRLRHLSLLQKLYHRILVPEAVVAELHAGHTARRGRSCNTTTPILSHSIFTMPVRSPLAPLSCGQFLSSPAQAPALPS